MRRLLSTRRHVPLDRLDEYAAAWLATRDAVAAAGGRAWLFRGAGHDDRFMEFVEWDSAAGEPLDSAEVRSAIARLGTFAPAADASEWEEAT
ncbi:MAG TPA: hypothetical protein VK936_08095 [Longimicrobiales bacterium]|nr:hypothetical protein [Longimicrobiales bacterium]